MMEGGREGSRSRGEKMMVTGTRRMIAKGNGKSKCRFQIELLDNQYNRHIEFGEI